MFSPNFIDCTKDELIFIDCINPNAQSLERGYQK
jgi:hypothetical protein